MIYCGYKGIGKTTLSKNNKKYLDLDLNKLSQNEDNIIKILKHFESLGYHIMISYTNHYFVNKLRHLEFNLVTISPDIRLYERYLKDKNLNIDTDTFNTDIRFLQDDIFRDKRIIISDLNYNLEDEINKYHKELDEYKIADEKSNKMNHIHIFDMTEEQRNEYYNLNKITFEYNKKTGMEDVVRDSGLWIRFCYENNSHLLLGIVDAIDDICYIVLDTEMNIHYIPYIIRYDVVHCASDIPENYTLKSYNNYKEIVNNMVQQSVEAWVDEYYKNDKVKAEELRNEYKDLDNIYFYLWDKLK